MSKKIKIESTQNAIDRGVKVEKLLPCKKGRRRPLKYRKINLNEAEKASKRGIK